MKTRSGGYPHDSFLHDCKPAVGNVYEGTVGPAWKPLGFRRDRILRTSHDKRLVAGRGEFTYRRGGVWNSPGCIRGK